MTAGTPFFPVLVGFQEQCWKGLHFVESYIRSIPFSLNKETADSIDPAEDIWFSLISAASIMMAAPIGILFILFQRNFIAGLTSGGLKG